MNTPDAIEKVELTHHLAELWRSGQISAVGTVSPPDRPARPDSLEVITPGKAVKVGKGGTLVSASITASLHSVQMENCGVLFAIYRAYFIPFLQ